MQETFDAKLALQNGLISKIVVGNIEAKEICKKISSYSSQVSKRLPNLSILISQTIRFIKGVIVKKLLNFLLNF